MLQFRNSIAGCEIYLNVHIQERKVLAIFVDKNGIFFIFKLYQRELLKSAEY